MKQTTFRKDKKGNEIFVKDIVAHKSKYFKNDKLKDVFVLKEVKISKTNSGVRFNLGDYCNLWDSKDCEIYSKDFINKNNIPFNNWFYFKGETLILVTEREYMGEHHYAVNKCISDRVVVARKELKEMLDKHNEPKNV